MIGEIEKELKADQSSVSDIEGGKRLELSRGECKAKLDIYEDYVNWVSLQSPGNEGWVKDAHDMVRKIFPKNGIKYLIASSADKKAEKILKAHGAWKASTNSQGKKCLRWDL